MDDQAQSVMAGLAGITPCPTCGRAMAIVVISEFPEHVQYHCHNQNCTTCCTDRYGMPLGCLKKHVSRPNEAAGDEYTHFVI